MKDRPVAPEETPEQAADAISNALDFLCGESDAIGMRDVSELIRCALAKTKESSCGR